MTVIECYEEGEGTTKEREEEWAAEERRRRVPQLDPYARIRIHRGYPRLIETKKRMQDSYGIVESISHHGTRRAVVVRR